MAKSPGKKASPPDLAAQIAKTGFVLENSVATILKAAGWSVISNKYYVDDHQETVREIDLVAYKVTKVLHIGVYTTLIISCKKSDKDIWAFLSRKIDLQAPNSNWSPFHVWTNDKPLNFVLKSKTAGAAFHNAVSGFGIKDALRTPDVDVFAFQEMDKITGAPHNDKAIFNAVTSLMKAQAYEMGALPKRKKDPVIYQFNLISVVDAPMSRLLFDDRGGVTTSEVTDEQYIARYIIQGKETFSRVRFIAANSFTKQVGEYSKLHSANCKWFRDQHEAFFVDILRMPDRVAVLADKFWDEVAWYLGFSAPQGATVVADEANRALTWKAETHTLSIEIEADDSALRHFGKNSSVRAHVAAALKEVFRYEGPFVFNTHIPF